MIIIDDIEQGETEWIMIRLGVLTASNADKILTPTCKASSQVNGIINTLVAERLLQEPVDDFPGNYWTDRGSLLEDQALAYFRLQTGLEPKRVGFVFEDDTRRCGCSPDFFVFDGDTPIAGGELKCPKASTHVGYLRDGDAIKYYPQVQFSLWVTGVPTWYFMSYYPCLPPVLNRVEPIPEWQEGFDKHVPPLLEKVEAEYLKLASF